MKNLIIIPFLLLSIKGLSQIDKSVDFEYSGITKPDSTIKKELEIFIIYSVTYDKKGRVSKITTIKEDCGGCSKDEKDYLIQKGREIINRKKTNTKNKAFKNMQIKTALDLKLIPK